MVKFNRHESGSPGRSVKNFFLQRIFWRLGIMPFSWIRELECARRPSGFQVPAMSGAGRASLGQAHENFGDN